MNCDLLQRGCLAHPSRSPPVCLSPSLPYTTRRTLLLMTIASLTDLSLPNALPSRCSCYRASMISAAFPSPVSRGVVACPIYDILYRTCLSLSVPLLIRLMRVTTVAAAATIATALPKPPDQCRPPRPRRRPAHLAGPPPLILVLVEPALTGEGPGLGCFLDIVAVPCHADEGGHGRWAAVGATCYPVG